MQPKHTLWVALLFCCLSSNAQTTWTGSFDTNWFNPLNWSAGLPSSGNQPATLPAVPVGGNFPSIGSSLTIDFAVNNFGALTLNAMVINRNTIVNTGALATIFNYATFVNQSGAILDNDNAVFNYSLIRNFGLIDNSGNLTIASSSSLQNRSSGIVQNLGSILNQGLVNNEGSINSSSGNISNHDDFRNQAGGNFQMGDFTNGKNTVPTAAGDFSNDGTVAVHNDLWNALGTITNRAAFSVLSSGSVLNDGTINNESNFLNGGSILNTSIFNNTGTLTNDFGSEFLNRGGTLSNASCHFIYHYTSNPLNTPTVVNNGIIYAVGSAVVVTSGLGIVLNSLGVFPAPIARCKPAFSLPLDVMNMANLTVADIDNVSTAPYCTVSDLTIAPSKFDCDDIGPNSVTLTVEDALGNVSQCQTIVTIQDTTKPVISCPANLTFQLLPFECGRVVDFLVSATDNCDTDVTITPLHASGLVSGDEFPIGTTTLVFAANDGYNTSTCSFTITVNEYVPYSLALACNDAGHLSLDECISEVLPEMVLIGDYGCSDDFLVQIMPGGGNTVDSSLIGKWVTVKVTDTLTGNNCWGQLLIEDKQPPRFDSCFNDTIFCVESILPTSEGGDVLTPVITSCSDFRFFYIDAHTAYDCNRPFSRKITRTWYARDTFGNESNCVQEIYIRRLRLRDLNITCPPIYETECRADRRYNLSPDITGYPTAIIDGLLYNLTDSTCYYCNLVPTFKDDTLRTCGSSFKILRTWKILDLCAPIGQGGNPFICTQIIKVGDNMPPVISPLPNLTFSVNTDDCTGQITLPAAHITDCSNFSVRIITPVGMIAGNGGRVPAPGLGFGSHQVTYVATDDCGRASSRTITVTINDQRPPVAVCQRFTTVSITTDTAARVYATVLDGGSHDECCLDRVVVRRMTDECNLPNDTLFQPYVSFCCADVGDTVQVVMRVYDCAGNFNDCMVFVLVDNRVPPDLTCPGDLTLECDRDYTDLGLTGRVVTNPAQRRVRDGFAESNCDGLTISYRDVANLVCNTGVVNRYWKATDADGDSTVCIQRIFMINSRPFDGLRDIIWPSDTTLYGCTSSSTDTSVTGAPIIIKDVCDQINVLYKDRSSQGALGNCELIFRDWTVINWCTYAPNDPLGRGIYTYTQRIFINDTIPPTLARCGNRLFCNENDRCEPVRVDLSIDVTDNCTNLANLSIFWTVDAFSDGVPDVGFEYSGTGMNRNNRYPIGTHRICYTIIDACGNREFCCFQFKIVDCKPPTAVCLNGLSTNVMANGMVTLNALYFENSSSDNCSPYNTLLFSFSADTDDTLRTFSCALLGLNPVKLYVTDETGNQDFCSTFIDVQDNMNICPTLKTASVAGGVKNEFGAGVTNVTVNVSGSGSGAFTTNNDGNFQFNSLPLGEDYSLTPQRNDNVANGISTIDIVLISKHILNVQFLDSPYKIIAADVNRTGTITTLDLVSLRKVVLRVDTEFKNNTSWRFIKKDFQFPNPENPFETAFPEVYNINNLDADMMTADFIAIKVGDVNGSAKANHVQRIEERTAPEPFILQVDNQSVKKGDFVTLQFKPERNESLLGSQFTLDFNPSALQLEAVDDSELMSRENFGLALLDEGAITVSWDNATIQTLIANQTLFSLHFRVLSDGLLSQWLSLSSRFTEAESYDFAGMTRPVNLRFSNGESGGEPSELPFVLYQNKPNPFNGTTVIGFQLPEASVAKLTIYDLSGKVLREFSGQFPNGYNEFRVEEKMLGAQGVLYYRIDTPQHTATKKMVLLDKR